MEMLLKENMKQFTGNKQKYTYMILVARGIKNTCLVLKTFPFVVTICLMTSLAGLKSSGH